jgi:hypothetical protein
MLYWNQLGSKAIKKYEQVYIVSFSKIMMGRKKRVRKNKQRGMHKKMLTGKKPMSEERKKELKKRKETQKEEIKNSKK